MKRLHLMRSSAALVLLLAATMGVSCVKRGVPSVRLPSVPEKPRFTASASSMGSTNEWRPIGSLPRFAPAVTSAPVVAPAAAYIPPARPMPTPVATPIVQPPMATNAPVVPVVAPSPSPASTGLAGSAVAYRLRPLDPIVINLRGIPPKDEQVEDQIDEAGFIRITYLQPIKAAGKTATELEEEIQRLYIDGKIYKSITVQVALPSQSFFVEGEVKQPGRIQLTSGVTLMQAIAQAGGYTDFADRTDVRIVRDGRTMLFNAKEIAKYPERDVRVEPGDRVIVGRSYI